MAKMNQKLREKVMEALSSVLPITAILLALSVTVVPIPIGTVLLFLAGAVLLILGMGLFSLGADMAMMPMGEAMGSRLTRTRRIGLVVLVFFLMGVIVTVAEPDLAVLARQVPAIPDSVLILTVAAGVGSFLVLAMLRTLFQIKLRHLLLFFYLLVFLVALFAPKSFLAVAFDSGGVTTGPITVPFIMALGIGMAGTRGDVGSQEDSFGMVALSSIGPILTVLILGICYDPSSAGYTAVEVPDIATSIDLARAFAKGVPHYIQEVFTAISGVLASDAEATGGKLENYSLSTLDLENSRQSISGVDLNDEATSMMQFSKSYSAACRLLTTIDSMLDTLINGTAR